MLSSISAIKLLQYQQWRKRKEGELSVIATKIVHQFSYP